MSAEICVYNNYVSKKNSPKKALGKSRLSSIVTKLLPCKDSFKINYEY